MSVSNLQILGAIDGLAAKIDALMEALQAGGMSAAAGMTGGDAAAAADDASNGAAPKAKRRRAKSKYNDHMSVELARLRDEYPDLGHRRRFAMAVQSWKDIKASQAAAETGSDAESGENMAGGAEEVPETAAPEVDAVAAA